MFKRVLKRMGSNVISWTKSPWLYGFAIYMAAMFVSAVFFGQAGILAVGAISLVILWVSHAHSMEKLNDKYKDD